MTRLRLSDITDGKPVKLTVEIPARLHRELVLYGQILNDGAAESAPEPAELVAPMLERFIASDRAFRKARQQKADRP